MRSSHLRRLRLNSRRISHRKRAEGCDSRAHPGLIAADILPRLVHRANVYACDFKSNRIPGDPPEVRPHWRDVGTLEAYYEANMGLRNVTPALNLYSRGWPVRSASHSEPPAKFVFDEDKRRGNAIESVVSSGCIISGGSVRRSVLGRGVVVHTGAVIEDSVILDNCDIGRGARIRRAILDTNVRIPADTQIGYDLENDRRNHFVSESGIVVVKGELQTVEVTVFELRQFAEGRRKRNVDVMRGLG